MNPRHLLAVPLCLLALVSTGCGSSDAPHTDSADTSSSASPELEPMPETALVGLPDIASEQISQQLQRLESTPADDSAARSEAYGRLAELYHAYDLRAPAIVGYGNALTLQPGQARWAYLQALALRREGRIDEAKQAFSDTLELEPDHRPAQLHLAEIHMTLADIDAAEKLYAAALVAEPEHPAALFGRGRIAEQRGQLEEAAGDYERALSLQPSAKNLHSLLASLYQRLEDAESAQRHLDQFGGGAVTFADPIFEEVKALVGGIGPMLEDALDALGAEDYALAAKRYLAVLDIEPDHANALSGAANALRKDGQTQRAIEVLRHSAKVHPENRTAQLELATLLLEDAQLPEAIERLEDLATAAPDFEQAHFNLGVALARAERWSEAIPSFRRSLELEPRDQTARFHLAIALEQTGSKEAALATLERAVREAPSFVRARQRLANMLEAEGRLADAEPHFRAVAELEEAPPPERALAAYQLGRLAALGGQDAEAIARFEQAVTWFPELWQAHVALARRHAAAGRFEPAAASFSAALEMRPEDIPARIEGAQALVAAGRHAEARQSLETGLVTLPKAAEIAHALARLLATSPDANVRDGRRAIQLASGVLEAYPWPVHAETFVMALAELGRFDEAARRQRQLIQGAKEEGRDGDIPRLEAHLEAYVAGRAVRLGPR